VDEEARCPESQFAFYPDEPALVTLGIYERFLGSAVGLTIQGPAFIAE
jgi:hypothetical protein